MKKTNILMLALLASASTFFYSCDDDQLEDKRNPKPTLSVDKKSVLATEGDVITFTVTIDKPLAKDVDFKIELESGSGNFRDFTCSGEETTIDEGGFGQGKIGYKLVLPALETSATFTITPNKDLFVEGSETLKLKLKSSGNMLAMVSPDSEFIDIGVNDFVSNNVGVDLVWGKVTNSHGTISDLEFEDGDGNNASTHDTDFDLFILNSAGTAINNTGATSANPEFTQLLATAPNGVYYVYAELYDFGSTPPVKPLSYDLTFQISKYGTWATTVKVPTTSDESFADVVAVIIKTGNNYVVEDIDGNTLASGKYKSIVENFKKSKRSK
ncbi:MULTISPECIES: hypothetical protein [Flavobacterium]|uniref:Calx-beta domain-containing protein n=1 Tax=Flavobacterium hankyongi TaxID=1176532 RepID=A0ABP8ZU38_9FLAO|nr:hypothetical protein [Flavobacterium sp. N1846]